MWHRLFRKATYLGPRGLPTAVVSGIDIALWDIKGKVTGRPVYDLLGGKVRDSVALYANGWFATLDGHRACATPEDYAAAAQRVVARGHVAIKLDPFHEMVPYHTGYLGGQLTAAGEAFGVACVAAIREAVGRRSTSSSTPTATTTYRRPSASPGGSSPTGSAGSRSRRRRRAWRRFGPCVSRSRGPSAWGTALHAVGLPAVLAGRLTDYVMPDVVWTGGISELMRIAALAETYHVPVTPHNAMGPLQVIAGAHAMLAVPNFYRLEHNVANVPWYDRCLDRPLDLRGDRLHLSQRPGLGVELDPAFLQAHRARGWPA